jgi:hypothetical protein
MSVDIPAPVGVPCDRMIDQPASERPRIMSAAKSLFDRGDCMCPPTSESLELPRNLSQISLIYCSLR